MKSLKTALINIRRMPYKSLIATGLIILTFFIAYSFSMLMIGSEMVLNFFETRPTVIAFFQIRVDDAEVNQVANSLEELDYVESIKVVSKEEALAYYQERQQNPLLLELVTADILPASIEISTTSPDFLPQIEQDLGNYQQIDEVVLQKEVIEQLTAWTRSLRMVGLVITSVLLLLTFSTIVSTIAFKIGNQGKFVNILRFIGASSGYIITPYVYEGFIYGFIGAVVGWGLMYTSFLYLMPWLKSFVGQIITLPPSLEFIAIQIGVGLTLGLFFGGFASIVAGKKLIKK